MRKKAPDEDKVVRKKISDIDVVLEGFKKIEDDSARFSEMLEMLSKVNQRFGKFEENYSENEASYREILSHVEEAKRQYQSMVDIINSKVSEIESGFKQHIEESNRLKEEIGHAVSLTDKTVEDFGKLVEQRADDALQPLRDSVDSWKKDLEDTQFGKLDNVLQDINLIERRTKGYEDRIKALEEKFTENIKSYDSKIDHWKARLEQVHNDSIQKLEQTNKNLIENLDEKLENHKKAVAEKFLLSVDSWKKHLEDTQFRKLDNVLQDINLIERRTKGYEDKVNALEEKFTENIKSYDSKVDDWKARIEQAHNDSIQKLEQTNKNLTEILKNGQKDLDEKLENHKKAVAEKLLLSEKTRKKLFLLCMGNLIALLVAAGLFSMYLGR